MWFITLMWNKESHQNQNKTCSWLLKGWGFVRDNAKTLKHWIFNSNWRNIICFYLYTPVCVSNYMKTSRVYCWNRWDQTGSFRSQHSLKGELLHGCTRKFTIIYNHSYSLGVNSKPQPLHCYSRCLTTRPLEAVWRNLPLKQRYYKPPRATDRVPWRQRCDHENSAVTDHSQHPIGRMYCHHSQLKSKQIVGRGLKETVMTSFQNILKHIKFQDSQKQI